MEWSKGVVREFHNIEPQRTNKTVGKFSHPIDMSDKELAHRSTR